MNLALSDCRAKHIQEYLIERYKLDPVFVKYKCYGESNPIIQDAEIKKGKNKGRAGKQVCH